MEVSDHIETAGTVFEAGFIECAAAGEALFVSFVFPLVQAAGSHGIKTVIGGWLEAGVSIDLWNHLIDRHVIAGIHHTTSLIFRVRLGQVTVGIRVAILTAIGVVLGDEAGIRQVGRVVGIKIQQESAASHDWLRIPAES